MLNKRAIFINTASQILVRIVTLGFTLLSIKLLTNYLGVGGFGNLNIITSYVNYFLVVADLGLFSVTVREISKHPDNERKIIANVFVIRLISALLVCALAVVILLFTPYKNDGSLFFGVIIACGFLLFNLMGSVGDMILQHRLKMQYSALAEFLSKLISIAALAAVILLHGSFLWVVFTAVALSGFLIFIFKWYFASRYVAIKPKYEQQLASWIFNLAWPMGIVFIASNLFFKLDTMMLFVMKGKEAVGIYSNVYKILEVTLFFGSYFASSLKPIISQSIDHKKAELRSVIAKSFNVMCLVSLPIAAIVAPYSKEIIAFFSNQDFLPGSPALIVLVFSLPIFYLDILLTEILIANDERKLLLKISFFILAFNFLINLILIPKYSFMGAAYSTLISEIVLLFIHIYFTQKIVAYQINFAAVGKIILAAAMTLLFAVFIKIFPLHFIVNMMICGVLFLGLVYALNILNLKTIKELISPDPAEI